MSQPQLHHTILDITKILSSGYAHVILGVSVESGEIQIGRGLRIIEVSVVCLKEVVNDQRGPVKEDTGYIVGMRPEFLARHDTVEDETWIW